MSLLKLQKVDLDPVYIRSDQGDELLFLNMEMPSD